MKPILYSLDLVEECLNQEFDCLKREQLGKLVADELLSDFSFVLRLSFVCLVAL